MERAFLWRAGNAHENWTRTEHGRERKKTSTWWNGSAHTHTHEEWDSEWSKKNPCILISIQMKFIWHDMFTSRRQTNFKYTRFGNNALSFNSQLSAGGKGRFLVSCFQMRFGQCALMCACACFSSFSCVPERKRVIHSYYNRAFVRHTTYLIQMCHYFW